MALAIETHKRALLKSISWRIFALTILGIISWIVTHSWIKVGLITIIYNLVQIFFFYLHERIWHKIKWGRIKHPLSEFDLNRELREEDKKIIEEQLKVLGYLD
jgi:uncharacterized membrane protein